MTEPSKYIPEAERLRLIAEARLTSAPLWLAIISELWERSQKAFIQGSTEKDLHTGQTYHGLMVHLSTAAPELPQDGNKNGINSQP